MSTEHFFEEIAEQSRIKAEIVSKYFWAWTKVIIQTVKKSGNPRKIAYIDLFAGTGRYEDGSLSTPLLILQKAIEDEDMREMLVTLFNDGDINHSQTLEREIMGLPGIDRMKYRPRIENRTVGTEIVNMFDQMKLVPTLFFVDPWGYKGLSLRLVNSVLKNWGCDCIFFFNYNRINMGLSNACVEEHMNALFGKKRADALRSHLSNFHPDERELAVVVELISALKEMGGKYVLPFCFKNDRGTRTTHHLFFVTKHFKGYEIMKDIMAKQSSDTTQGVPSFAYHPATPKQLALFEFLRPLEELCGMLLRDFAGKTVTMKMIYETHSADKWFVKANYREALGKLEEEGKIRANPPAHGTDRCKARRKGTFSDTVQVTFPPQK